MAAVPSIGSYGAQLDLKIKQGSTFAPSLGLKNPDGTPVDLTNCMLRGQIRKKALDVSIVVALTFEILDAAAGSARMSLTDEQTAAITAGETTTTGASKYVYDVEMEDSQGAVRPLLYGAVTVFREVTR